MPKSWSLTILWRLTQPSRTNTHTHTHTHTKGVFFITGDWNAKVGSQETPGMTGKFGLAVQNINRVLSREHAVQSKTLFLQHKKQCYTWTWSTGGGNGNPLQYFGHKDITRWSISKSDWLCSLQLQMEKLYTVSKNKTWCPLWLRTWVTYCKI